MCRRHWYRVHAILRTAVWNSYRPGQCDDGHPSEAWHRAADAAIGYVAYLESKTVTTKEWNALTHFKLYPGTGRNFVVRP